MFIVSMGIPHKDIDKLEGGRQFIKAVIQVIDWDRKKVVNEISYNSPPENLGRGINQSFKGACLHEDKYFVAAHTELLEYNITNWKLENVVSHSSFNDLHGVYVDGSYVYLCNTGLEVVQLLKNGRIEKTVNMAETPTWERFSTKTDYRTVPNTQPHEAHINHISFFNETLWVTRFNKRDVVALFDKTKRISLPIDVGCHDGRVVDDSVFFTTVNGHILEIGTGNLTLKNDYDVNSYFSKNIGWARGLEIREGYAYLGTTALRHSRYKEYAKGLIKGKNHQRMPSSIIKIDLHRKKAVDVFEIPYNRAAVYSILYYSE